LLLQGVAKYHKEGSDWVRVAAFVSEAMGEEGAVNNDQCRKRYQKTLDPKLAGRKGKDVPWVEEEVRDSQYWYSNIVQSPLCRFSHIDSSNPHFPATIFWWIDCCNYRRRGASEGCGCRGQG